MTNRAEFERLLDVYGFRCERFGQDLSTHARAQVVSAFAALASAPVAGEAPTDAELDKLYRETVTEGPDNDTRCWENPHRLYARAVLSRYAAPQASEAVRIHNDAIKTAAQVCVDIARQYDPQNNQENALASELYAAARVIRRHEKAGPAALSATQTEQGERDE